MKKKNRYRIPDKKVIELYATMLRIRHFEEEIIRLYPEQEIRTPVHLYIGQEAIAAGVCCALGQSDHVFTTHRGHGVYIAKGGSLKMLAAELYGKQDGCSKGKGGSMHVADMNCSICGTTAIVGGNIPLAVGAALAAQLKETGNIACAFFGDGATDEGAFYESLNFAALKRLPVLFICENNFYATHSHQSARQPLDNIFQRGSCFGMPGERIDGNDAMRVYLSAQKAAARARSGKGPTLIECRTYRWKSHVGPASDEELDLPPKKYLHRWLKKCPVERLKEYIVKRSIMTKEEEKRAIKEIDLQIEDAFRFARKSPLPDKNELCKDLFG